MSISSWTLSFSSSPRTWLNFFMKSWAFPASGRFSVSITKTWLRSSVILSGTNLHHFEEMTEGVGWNKYVVWFPTYWQYSSASQTWQCYWPQTTTEKREKCHSYVATFASAHRRGMLCTVGVGVSTHHRQLVEIQQLFDEASEHVLTLPHLIQGPENKRTNFTKRLETSSRWGVKTNRINKLSMWYIFVDLFQFSWCV